jgi:hypothetical protein
MGAAPTVYWVAEAPLQKIYAPFGARVNLGET